MLRGNPHGNEEGQAKTNLGVLYTGYLDKKSRGVGSYISSSYKKRFAVLTTEAIHWFKRNEGYDLFGEEKGQVPLINILSIRVLDNDSSQFELQSSDNNSRYFRASSTSACEEWVSAVRSAMKAAMKPGTNNKTGLVVKANRKTLSGIRNMFLDNETDRSLDSGSSQEVAIFLVSHRSMKKATEIVLGRNIPWMKRVQVADAFPGDELIISTSNGGTLTVSFSLLEEKALSGEEFEVSMAV